MGIFGLITGHYFGGITGMVLMEVNHVSPSNQNRFRVIGLITVIALFWLPDACWQANVSCEIIRIGSRNQVFRAENSLMMAWHVKRLCVLFGASLLVLE